MDCKTARLLLDYARPASAELEAADAEALAEHVADCPDCGGLARAEGRVDQHMGAALRAVPVPEGLRDRVLSRLTAERRRRLRRRLLAGAGLVSAAAAVVAIVLPLTLGHHKRLVVGDVSVAYHDRMSQLGKDRDEVADWFQARYHVRMECPPQLNYNKLVYFDMADFQGVQVPMLLFVHGQQRAFVYVLSGQQFDLNALDNSGGYPVQLLRSADGRFAYVVVYTGDNLTDFLDNGVTERAT